MSERKANRLIHQKSPYLLQHAYNPVDWFAWGEEAFERARQDDKPVLLSIGYSTCHWCHVMEHESFENENIARLMNENFVSIKVDREERPDLDQIYMTAVGAITGQGGWPLNVFLTADGQPFYGGTYFPPHSRFGHPGFSEVLTAVSHSWKNDRSRILAAGAELTALLRGNFSKNFEGAAALDESTLDVAFRQLQSQFDGLYGGFGNAPKFPMGHTLSFLLRYVKRTGTPESLTMARTTLRRMASGGMYDHLGGGFHRYSTDAFWHVPHFEKMLYDQALLARAYLESYQISKDPFDRQVVVETLEYVLRDLRDPGGAFYSAEDADSLETGGTHKKEGAFYVWNAAEIKEILEERDAAIFFHRFGVEDNGNVRSDPYQEFTSKNILFAAHSIEETAGVCRLTVADVEASLRASVSKLFEVRLKRPRPHLDDKILVDWNGLMIAALAMAAAVLNEDRYRTAARQAADFLLKNMMTPQGRLLHRYRDQEAAILATLEDYAFLSFGLLELYGATFEIEYLKAARQLAESMLSLFWDQDNGGFFLTGADAEELIARPKDIYDGALPSGNSVAALVLLRLYHLTSKEIYLTRAEELFEAFAGKINQHPSGYTFCLAALDFALGPVSEIVLTGDPKSALFQPLRRAVEEPFIPNKVVVAVPKDSEAHAVELIPLLNNKREGQTPLAYVCQGQTCRPPVSSAAELTALLTDRSSV